MGEENEKREEWYGWKDIMVSGSLIGDTVKKGKDIWEKEYRFIKIPSGYGYDGYCFVLSEKLVHSPVLKKDNWWFSICHDMNIELIYLPELREDGKRYKRFKLSGRELVNEIFGEYEVDFHKQSEERLRKERERKEKRDKKNDGKIVCGIYTGNNFGRLRGDTRYIGSSDAKAFFSSYGGADFRYSNSVYEKVENVSVLFEIRANVSKYDFLQVEEIINMYLEHIGYFTEMKSETEKHLKSRMMRKEHDITMQIAPAYDLLGSEMDDVIGRLKEVMLVHLDWVLCEDEQERKILHDRLDDLKKGLGNK